jgi:hypothetical protein
MRQTLDYPYAVPIPAATKIPPLLIAARGLREVCGFTQVDLLLWALVQAGTTPRGDDRLPVSLLADAAGVSLKSAIKSLRRLEVFHLVMTDALELQDFGGVASPRKRAAARRGTFSGRI